MEIVTTTLNDVKIIKLNKFEDDRGFFVESFNQGKWDKYFGNQYTFVQDNHSRSTKNVLRGLHFQEMMPQGKLVRVTRGKIYDVVVDIRPQSSTFKKWLGVTLSEDTPELLWVPPGFAHGFLVLSDIADVCYKVTNPYHAPSDRTLIFNDKSIGINWPFESNPLLSPKDAQGKCLEELVFSC